MMHLTIVGQLLVLLAVANGAPVIAKLMFGDRFSFPLDGYTRFTDGHPLFGTSKTVRGIVAAIAVAVLAAPLLGLEPKIGLTVGAGAMIGDLLSSFLKRRIGLAPSCRATGLDQIPESLLPLLACSMKLPLTVADITAGTAAFFVGELVLSRLLFAIGVRDRPY